MNTLIGTAFRERAAAAYQEQLKEIQDNFKEHREKNITYLTDMLQSQGIDTENIAWSYNGDAIIEGVTIERGKHKDTDHIFITCELCGKVIAKNLYSADSVYRLAGWLYTSLGSHQERDCPKAPPIPGVSNYDYATGLMRSVPWITADEGAATHVQRTLIYSVLALVDAINEHSQPKY